ncbi:methylated-DNA-[protein]-cysteine S-methyltransferase [Kitasatospora sp. SolWspMP-SS2h]|nr:methylated-DNA-[protein]-cysteine S-methyltransferase [Kitasatospora sp. SolWspMP-SS2h]
MTVCTTTGSPLGELLLGDGKSDTAKGATAPASLSVPGQKDGAVVQDDWTRDATRCSSCARGTA